MNTKELFKTLDNLVFSQTGKHLVTLQLGILKNVFNGQKYSQIAQEYNCSEGHARDKAYELWHILSETLGEELNKSNVRSAIERFTATNSNIVINPGRIGNINLCPTSLQSPENLEVNIPNNVDAENPQIENKFKQLKLETVPKLTKLGLTAEQISETLDLELSLILDTLQ